MLKKLITLLTVILAFSPGLAAATIINSTYDFTIDTSGGPVTTVVGSFTLHNFDTEGFYSNDTSVLTMNSINITVDSAVGLTSAPASFGGGTTIGGLQNGASAIGAGTNDFFLGFDWWSGPPSFSSFGYVTTTGSIYGFTGGSITPASNVPEPNTSALLAAGAAAGFLVRRRQRKSRSKI